MGQSFPMNWRNSMNCLVFDAAFGVAMCGVSLLAIRFLVRKRKFSSRMFSRVVNESWGHSAL